MTAGNCLKPGHKIGSREKIVPFLPVRKEPGVFLKNRKCIHIQPVFRKKTGAKENLLFPGSGDGDVLCALSCRMLPPPHAYLIYRKGDISPHLLQAEKITADIFKGRFQIV